MKTAYCSGETSADLRVCPSLAQLVSEKPGRNRPINSIEIRPGACCISLLLACTVQLPQHLQTHPRGRKTS